MKKTFAKKLAAAVATGALALGLAGCAADEAKNNAPAENGAAGTEHIVVGTMATEDILPYWVAEAEGLFEEAGLDVEVQVFQSAQELSTALTAGAVQMAMTDAQVASSLTAGGCPMTLAWVTLGTEADQGRFGIMANPDAGITSLSDLAGVPIGVGSNTVPEYVMDRLMESAGVAADDIMGEEIKKLPVRYEMMTTGQVKAAALPGALLALGEAQGMVLVADDTQGENISQSHMAVRTEWADANADTLAKMAEVWNTAAARVNAAPENYRALLIEKANLSDLVAETYPIATYPETMVPIANMVEPVLEWMDAKGYLTASVTYDAETGKLMAA